MTNQPPSIYRATKASLAAHQANFTLDGLKFHFGKLTQYTNPSGGALDKSPLNTKAHTSAYFAQFENGSGPSFFGPAPWHDPQPPKPIFLRKKAQYQVADHLLGIGQKSYWTGSTGQSTLLGLDIDDHESLDAEEVQANSEQALKLFIEMTGLKPVPCKSPRGINAFLICHKNGMTTQFTNETWHSVVRLVNAEGRRRGLAAKLECKGKARIFNNKMVYCGVQFKDPLYATNPTDEQLHAFWDGLESRPVTGIRLHDLLTTLENEKHCAKTKASSIVSVKTDDDLLPSYKGNWAKQCREWAIHGLPCDDSLATVVTELAKWLYFVELWEVGEPDRVQRVADLLFEFVRLKHNGYVTRINRSQENEVKSQIGRIVESVVSRMGERGKAIFAKLQSQPHMKLVPLMESIPLSAPFSSVKSNECCTVSKWLPAPEYRRQRAAGWDYLPDDTPLPETLQLAISKYYKKNGLKIKKPTMVKLQHFLNHLWTSPGHEAPLGVDALRKYMKFGNDARKHIKNLVKMGVIETSHVACAAAGVSKGHRLRKPAVKMFAEARLNKPAKDVP